MKGITVWIWMVAGVIVGLLLFTVFVQLLGITTTTRQIQMAKTTFDELASNADSFCGTFGVAKITRTYAFPEIVTRMYATDASKAIHAVNGRTYGNVICMNATRELDCQNIGCMVEMSNLNSTNKLSGILDRLSGGFQTTDFQLDVEKTECGVAIVKSGESPTNFCGGTCSNVLSLVQCQGHKIISLLGNNVLLMSDFTPFYDCCDVSMLKLLNNAANFLGGSKVLVVYEHSTVGTKLPGNLGTIAVDSFRHTSEISPSALQGYNQVWILLPGFCNLFDSTGRTAECRGIVGWSPDEITAIKDFVDSGGKLFLVSDYTPFANNVVPNRILDQLGYSAKFGDGCFCGCNGSPAASTDITNSKITKGITSWTVRASSEISC